LTEIGRLQRDRMDLSQLWFNFHTARLHVQFMESTDVGRAYMGTGVGAAARSLLHKYEMQISFRHGEILARAILDQGLREHFMLV